MYIARRTGGGRGVYEIAGQTATGLTSGDLVDREVVFEMTPELLLPSGVVLHIQGGKHRLNMETRGIQIHRQIAAALMLPSPRRADAGHFGTTNDIARTKEYAVERIQLDFVDTRGADTAVVVPDLIELRNSAATVTLSIQARLAAVAAIWANAGNLPETLRIPIVRHHDLVTAGDPITVECESIVAAIQQATAAAWPEETDSLTDPVPFLTSHLAIVVGLVGLPAEPPMNAETFAFEGEFNLATANGVPERVRRSIIQRRGQWAFRRALVSGYGACCQVTQYTGEPALEAAHIWPYSDGGEYTNDPRNGLLLRADIHVLFDLGLVKVTPESLVIRIMPPLAASSYGALEGNIVRTSPSLRPSNEALARKWQQGYAAA